jgi:hypothetical protein
VPCKNGGQVFVPNHESCASRPGCPKSVTIASSS